MFSYEWEFKVRFAETDAAGIVYYPNFYKWMDQAMHEMLAHISFPTGKIIASGNGLPLVEAHCQFRRPLQFDEVVKVTSTVVEVRDKVIKVAHVFTRGETLIADGYEIRAWVKLQDGVLKAEPLPEHIRQKLLVPVQN